MQLPEFMGSTTPAVDGTGGRDVCGLCDCIARRPRSMITDLMNTKGRPFFAIRVVRTLHLALVRRCATLSNVDSGKSARCVILRRCSWRVQRRQVKRLAPQS